MFRRYDCWPSAFLNELQRFCNSVGKYINFDKTKIVVHRNGGALRLKEKWWFEVKNVEIVSFFKYLGIFSHQS